MYLQHFGLREFPFSLTPDTGYFLPCPGHSEALNTLLFALRSGEGFTKITGEVGTGKTLLCRKLLSELGEEFVTAYLPNPPPDPDALVSAVAMELGLASSAGSHALLRELTRLLVELDGDGRRVVVILDEAQALPEASLEAVRLLTNLETEKRKLLQVVLFGQPELDERLACRSLRQMRQRIGFSHRLRPLRSDELASYVEHRLRVAGRTGMPVFTAAALDALWRTSGGVPRLAHVLAHKALLVAYGRGEPRVDRAHVRRAAVDTEGVRRVRAPRFPFLEPRVSLLNDVLRDLDARREARPAAPDLDALAGPTQAGPPRPPRHRRSRHAAYACAVGLALLAAALWPEREAAPAAPPAVASAPPGPATAPPTVRPEPSAHETAPTEPISPIPIRVATRTRPETARETAAAAETSPAAVAAPVALRPSPLGRAAQSYRAGLAAAARGDDDSAGAALLEALATDPTHRAARLSLATLWARQGAHADALALLAEGRALDPRHAGYVVLEARVRAAAGDAASAIRLLEAAAPALRHEPELFALLAALEQQRGDAEAAGRHWEQALRFDARRGAWWLGLGVAREGEGRAREALDAYRQAHRAGGLAADARQWLATRIAALGGD